MEPEIIHLSVLTFLAGVFCKIYDDLNDNNLFEKHSFLLKNKEYINEMLKGLHYILLTYVSSKYIYPILFVATFVITQASFDEMIFKMPYDLSSTVIFLLFSVYLCFSHIEQLKTFISNVLILFYIVVGVYLFDIFLCPNTVEFGYTKLAVRFFGSISILLVHLTNYFFHFIPDEELFWLWHIVGYSLTSSCFQLYLIRDSEKNTIIKEETDVKEKNKEEDKEKNKEEDKIKGRRSKG